jgi:hypothetical protein
MTKSFLLGVDLLLKWKTRKFGQVLKHRFLSLRRGRRKVRSEVA